MVGRCPFGAYERAVGTFGRRRAAARCLRRFIGSGQYKVGNIDATICAERPKLKAHIPLMQETMATVMGIDADDISIKATTTEKLGFTGREEGISAYATVLIEKTN